MDAETLERRLAAEVRAKRLSKREAALLKKMKLTPAAYLTFAAGGVEGLRKEVSMNEPTLTSTEKKILAAMGVTPAAYAEYMKAVAAEKAKREAEPEEYSLRERA
jgi:hypothetical protein